MAKTQSQYLQIYNNAITSLDSNIATGIPGTDIYFKANAVSQIAANISNDIDNLYNNIFPASSSGAFLDRHGLNVGLTPRNGALPSVGTIYLDNSETATDNFSIDVDSVLTSAITGKEYYVTSTVDISIGTVLNTVPISIASSEVGSGNSSPIDSELTFETEIIVDAIHITTATISSITTGSNIETDSEYATRLYNYIHFPRGAGSIGDYIRWCYQANENVTQSDVIKNSSTGSLENTSIFFPVVMGGPSNPNYYIDGDEDNSYAQTAFPIDRSLNSVIVTSVQDYVNNQKGVNDNPQVITCSTYEIPGVLNVYASLSTGITFDTLLTFPDYLGGNITVGNLIKKEIRRTIIGTPAKGNLMNVDGVTPDYYISVADIEASVISKLSNNNYIQGTVASILTGLYINYEENSTILYYIPLPSVERGTIIDPTTYQAQIIYDIDVSNNVTLYNQGQP